MTSEIGRKRKVVILGGLSTIGEWLARHVASDGGEVVLAARNDTQMQQVAADLRARGASNVHTVAIDLAAERDVRSSLAAMVGKLGGKADAIVLLYGVLGDQKQAESDQSELDRIIDVNFTSAARWCVASGDILEKQKHGVLVAVSSVAGDRGRQSNYVYGAAKAGLTVLVQGLAHRLAPSGASAVAVKLGFVDTAMTAHIEKGGPLWAKPDAVARQLLAIIDKPRGPVVYRPWFWMPIMTVIRSVPSAIFHKTKL